MLIVTGGTAEYRPYIERQATFCKTQGYTHEIHDLGGLGMGRKTFVDPAEFAATLGGGLPAARFKPKLMLDQWVQSGDLVAWLDGDCVPVLPIEPPGDWDAAVTLRSDTELGASGIPATDWLNSGVVFVRWTRPGFDFLDDWLDACSRTTGDQTALNDVVGKGWDRFQWAAARGVIVEYPGYRIQILSSPEWNCWQFPAPPEARILHYKRGLRRAFAP